MIYTVIILLLFSVIILIRKYTNRYTFILAGLTLCLNLAIISSLIFVAKLGHYQYPDYAIFLPDYNGYLFLSRLKISYYTIIRLQNIGFAGFIACLPLFLTPAERSKKSLMLIGASFLLPVFYVIFYDPQTRLQFMTMLYGMSATGSEQVHRLLILVNKLNYVWIGAYMIMPLAQLLYLAFKNEYSAKKKQLLSLFFSLLCLNMLCLFIFIVGPFRQTYQTLSMDTLLCFPESSFSYNYSYLSILALVLSNAMLILLFRFHGLDSLDFFRDFIISRLALKPNKQIRNILHTYKNEMLSINMLARQLAQHPEPERAEYLVKRLEAISENALKSASNSLYTFKQVETSPIYADVTECIDHALSRTELDKNIQVVRDYRPGIFAYCDRTCLENSLRNILDNAQDAIRLAERKRGEIRISVSREYEWISISVTDNGIGIPKKELRKVFRAFYSTKSSSSNWGVGLNYVFRSIKNMKGFVSIESDLGRSTTFRITLQQKNNRIRGEKYGSD